MSSKHKHKKYEEKEERRKKHKRRYSDDSEDDDERSSSSRYRPKKKESDHRHKHKKEKKKKSKRSKSSDSSTGSDSSTTSDSSTGSDSVKLLKRLHNKHKLMIQQKKKEKELMKANETPEEKRIRRLLKKEAKERKRKQRMGWDKDYLHYTNTDNPFGDANLLSTFVWSKKLAKDGLTDVSREELERINRTKQEENKVELEKVKKRRQEREQERQEREEAMMRLQREKEAEQFEAWATQEDQFHLEQARLRSRIRIADARAKPIDLLAKYINSEEEVDAVEMHEPYTYLNGLSIKDLEDLVEDIKVYMKLEKGKNFDYWNDITVIVEDELYKLRKMVKKSDYEAAVGRREGIHESVAKEVSSVFRGKTASQLAAMQKQIEKKISDKGEGIDIGYWESLLSQLKAHMARARLRDKHQENLKQKLELLKAEQRQQEQEIKEEPLDESEFKETIVRDEFKEEKEDSEEEQSGGDDDAGESLLKESFGEYEAGAYSPVYVDPASLEPGTLVIAEEEDAQRLEYARQHLTSHESQVGATSEELAMQREARKGMSSDEAIFSVESALDSQVYLWSDKYRPRKPRYFNRVHTGFEWNKYNQTHYDMDNPPPKIVQGYKFNIFFPDLIDKTTTPEYYLTTCPDNPDFAVLRFHAGPPYEDIAFKIVNREWEYSYKRGFRCQFHNNIFQLWFHFKRYRYRR
ncbi:splicing factor Cactin [Halyomorpha halys]|uniref:splicing factor Cactin n=1 Tax=Halyomorpha halys TaxID=286706 RepID=UPI0006D4F6A1|nr:cactin [Halyomorpha halys]